MDKPPRSDKPSLLMYILVAIVVVIVVIVALALLGPYVGRIETGWTNL